MALNPLYETFTYPWVENISCNGVEDVLEGIVTFVETDLFKNGEIIRGVNHGNGTLTNADGDEFEIHVNIKGQLPIDGDGNYMNGTFHYNIVGGNGTIYIGAFSFNDDGGILRLIRQFVPEIKISKVSLQYFQPSEISFRGLFLFSNLPD